MRSELQADPDRVQAPREILMVEDSATDAELALRSFKLAKFTNPVTVVASSEQGLAYLSGTGAFSGRGPTRPQLILLDLNLPGMSGIDFLHRIKADGRTRDIPVVVLSLSERDRDVTACVQLGAEAYLVKPLNFENFARIINRLKLRLTLVAPLAAGRAGGWVLSGVCEVSPGRSPGGSSSGADAGPASTQQPPGAPP